jgi:hypothetical protein
MFDFVKHALRVTSDAHDDEIQTFIDSALRDLSTTGIDTSVSETDKFMQTAVMMFVKSCFDTTADSERYRNRYSLMKKDMKLKINEYEQANV